MNHLDRLSDLISRARAAGADACLAKTVDADTLMRELGLVRAQQL